MEIKLMKNIMDANHKLADKNKELFINKNIKAVNIMASPGAGKTSIIVEMINALRDKMPVNVIEGDIASSIDADKIDKMGIPVIQINTGGGCHLDANMISEAVNSLNTPDNAILFIENVGNLVCPSSFDLGETIRMVIASVPEGHDKPFKYISMFESADVVVLSKIDLVEPIGFERDQFYKGVRALRPDVPVFEVSCRTGEGLKELSEWLSM